MPTQTGAPLDLYMFATGEHNWGELMNANLQEINDAIGAVESSLTLPSGAGNLVLATPDGAAGMSALRALVEADVPDLSQAKITNLSTDLANLQTQIDAIEATAGVAAGNPGSVQFKTDTGQLGGSDSFFWDNTARQLAITSALNPISFAVDDGGVDQGAPIYGIAGDVLISGAQTGQVRAISNSLRVLGGSVGTARGLHINGSASSGGTIGTYIGLSLVASGAIDHMTGVQLADFNNGGDSLSRAISVAGGVVELTDGACKFALGSNPIVNAADLTTGFAFNFGSVSAGSIRSVYVPDADSTLIEPSSGNVDEFVTGIDAQGVLSYSTVSIPVTPVNAPAQLHEFLSAYNDTSGAFSFAQPDFSDLTGQIASTQLIAPTASTFGGVKSLAASATKFLTSIGTDGVPVAAQPAFSDLSGSISAGQIPSGAVTWDELGGSMSGGQSIPFVGATSGTLSVAPMATANGLTFVSSAGAVNLSASAGLTLSGSSSTSLQLANGSQWTTGVNATISMTQTGGSANCTFINQSSATSIQSQSVSIKLVGKYWDGSLGQQDIWTVQNSIANGTNGASTLTLTHAGSPSNPHVTFSGLGSGSKFSFGNAIIFTGAALGLANSAHAGLQCNNTTLDLISSSQIWLSFNSGSNAQAIFQATDYSFMNITAATNSVSQSSPTLTLNGKYWDGAASQPDTWTLQNILANGTNGISKLLFTHAGTSGGASFAVNTPYTGTSAVQLVVSDSGTNTGIIGSNSSHVQALIVEGVAWIGKTGGTSVIELVQSLPLSWASSGSLMGGLTNVSLSNPGYNSTYGGWLHVGLGQAIGSTLLAPPLLSNAAYIASNTGGSMAMAQLSLNVGILGSCVFNQLANPSAGPTITVSGGAGSTTWSYKVVAKDAAGNVTAVSAAGSISTQNATLNSSATNRINVAPCRVAGAVTYDVYRTTAGTSPSTTGKIATITAFTPDTGLITFDGGSLTLSSVANASGGNTVYTGTITNGATTNGYIGCIFTVAGFTTGANNGTFVCVGSTATTLTLANASGVSETKAATATQAGDGTTPPTVNTTGTISIPAGNTAASATAGASGAPPSQVAGYLIVKIGGTDRKIPFYAV